MIAESKHLLSQLEQQLERSMNSRRNLLDNTSFAENQRRVHLFVHRQVLADPHRLPLSSHGLL